MTWLSESLSFLVHMTLFALCTVVVPIIVSFIWHWLEETCARRQLFSATGAALLAFAIALMPTIAKRTGTTGDPSAIATQEHDPLSDWESRHPGGGVRSGESDATLRFESIDVHSNDTATLRLAWPLDLIPTNTTIDLLVATSLVNSAWTWQCGHVVGEDDTNWIVTVALPETSPGTAAPSAFYRAVHRETCADTMDDLDGDGIPGAYELAHGTNPYVADAEDVPRLTVGADGQYATIQAALAASVPYSVIELDADTAYAASGYGYDVPQHPVMITAPRPYAVVRSTGIAAFMLANGSTSRTLFRNLYLLLDAKSSFQVGFWCGGNLPTIGTPASATFENVYVRMPNAGVQYRGWLFYRNCADMAVLRNCTLNAAGATWIYGVDAFGSPPILFDRCSFVNFPEDSETSDSYGIVLRTNASSDGGAEVTANRTLFDESFADAWPLGRADSAKPYLVTACGCILPRAFPATHCPDAVTGTVVTNAALAWCGVPRAASPSAALGIGSLTPIANDPNADSDGDGLCDYGEAYFHGTDPWLADSDRDGVSDHDEIFEDNTDPTDPNSFLQHLEVTVTNTASLAFPIRVAWGYSETGWETNGLAVFDSGFGETTYTNASSHGATHVKAFCDIDGNGTFEADCDILLVRQIPSDSMAQVRFTFGDVDGDGVPDAQEREEQTDPYDNNNFRMVVTVKVTNDDNVPSITNFLAYGYGAMGWETNGLGSFSYVQHQPFSMSLASVVTNGSLYVKCYRDLNRNGLYDDADGTLIVYQISAAYNGKDHSIVIGDNDCDGIPDSVEMTNGSDPTDARSYCFSMDVAITDIFQTTNALTAEIRFGDARVYGPYVMTETTCAVTLGHFSTTNAERLVACFWDDVNGNETLDDDEISIQRVLDPKGHNSFCDVQLQYGAFDANMNGLLDYWEQIHGVNDPNADPDGDGMLNIQEHAIGSDPLHYDGTNNLFAVASRSVDGLIADRDSDGALAMFEDYYVNAPNLVFTSNTNLWTKDIDFSCISVWNNDPYVPGQRAGALITSNHFLIAEHWAFSVGQTLYFRGTDALVYTSVVVAVAVCPNMGYEYNWFPDLRLLTLSPALPPGIVNPVPLMDQTSIDNVRTGIRIPVLMVNQFKEIIVRDIQTFNPHGGNGLRRFVQHMEPFDAKRKRFSKSIIGGDSGSPTFLLVNGRLVLVGLHTTTTCDSPIWRFLDWIRSVTEASGYAASPEVFDASSFGSEP